MAFFYDRNENADEIVITLKYQAAFYFLLLGAIAVAYVGPFTGLSETVGLGIITVGVIIPLFVYSIAKLSINSEIRKAMKSGSVQISGSKFSFSQPLTFRIKK